jgi:hypothetical protein
VHQGPLQFIKYNYSRCKWTAPSSVLDPDLSNLNLLLIRIRIKVKIKKLQRLTMEANMLIMEPWRVYRPVVADSHSL